MPVPLPDWNSQGFIPPNDPNDRMSANRSPYRVTLVEFVEKFCTSPERKTILAGFLRYRAALHGIGMVTGFHWVDGSFLENIEQIETRAPRDIDLVTFYDGSQPMTPQQHANAVALFSMDQDTLKKTFLVDAYATSLNQSPAMLVEICAYWYGAWSHRRDNVWKGFVEIDLAPHHDRAAVAALAQITPAASPFVVAVAANSPPANGGNI